MMRSHSLSARPCARAALRRSRSAGARSGRRRRPSRPGRCRPAARMSSARLRHERQERVPLGGRQIAAQTAIRRSRWACSSAASSPRAASRLDGVGRRAGRVWQDGRRVTAPSPRRRLAPSATRVERRLNGRMRRRVQRDDAGRRLARACEVGQPRGLVGESGAAAGRDIEALRYTAPRPNVQARRRRCRRLLQPRIHRIRYTASLRTRARRRSWSPELPNAFFAGCGDRTAAARRRDLASSEREPVLDASRRHHSRQARRRGAVPRGHRRLRRRAGTTARGPTTRPRPC